MGDPAGRPVTAASRQDREDRAGSFEYGYKMAIILNLKGRNAWTTRYPMVFGQMSALSARAACLRGVRCTYSYVAEVVTMLRTSILIAILSLFIAGCSESGVAAGIFNNQPDYDVAVREHEAAWAHQFGHFITAAQLSSLIGRSGGECVNDDNLVICVVNVAARKPRIFKQRYMWRVELQPLDGDKLIRKSSHLDMLGWDL
jgi:hypothetical protein